MTSPSVREIQIAHSPDSDDAFMFYGLATKKITVPGYKFVHNLTDIETLNQRAIKDAFYDVTAISFHAYPYLQDNYTLMACGASMGEGYGPMLVAPRKVKPADIAKLLIHEGQLTYGNDGLQKILDLGAWWRTETGLPLPLGGNVIRRALGRKTMLATTQAVRDSIQHALEHRDEALEYAMQFARDLDPNLANRYVGMYVNERSIDLGQDGREAVRRILAMGHERGIIPIEAKVDFIG